MNDLNYSATKIAHNEGSSFNRLDDYSQVLLGRVTHYFERIYGTELEVLVNIYDVVTG